VAMVVVLLLAAVVVDGCGGAVVGLAA